MATNDTIPLSVDATIVVDPSNVVVKRNANLSKIVEKEVSKMIKGVKVAAGGQIQVGDSLFGRTPEAYQKEIKGRVDGYNRMAEAADNYRRVVLDSIKGARHTYAGTIAGIEGKEGLSKKKIAAAKREAKKLRDAEIAGAKASRDIIGNIQKEYGQGKDERFTNLKGEQLRRLADVNHAMGEYALKEAQVGRQLKKTQGDLDKAYAGGKINQHGRKRIEDLQSLTKELVTAENALTKQVTQPGFQRTVEGKKLIASGSLPGAGNAARVLKEITGAQALLPSSAKQAREDKAAAAKQAREDKAAAAKQAREQKAKERKAERLAESDEKFRRRTNDRAMELNKVLSDLTATPVDRQKALGGLVGNEQAKVQRAIDRGDTKAEEIAKGQRELLKQQHQDAVKETKRAKSKEELDDHLKKQQNKVVDSLKTLENVSTGKDQDAIDKRQKQEARAQRAITAQRDRLIAAGRPSEEADDYIRKSQEALNKQAGVTRNAQKVLTNLGVKGAEAELDRRKLLTELPKAAAPEQDEALKRIRRELGNYLKRDVLPGEEKSRELANKLLLDIKQALQKMADRDAKEKKAIKDAAKPKAVSPVATPEQVRLGAAMARDIEKQIGTREAAEGRTRRRDEFLGAAQPTTGLGLSQDIKRAGKLLSDYESVRERTTAGTAAREQVERDIDAINKKTEALKEQADYVKRFDEQISRRRGGGGAGQGTALGTLAGFFGAAETGSNKLNESLSQTSQTLRQFFRYALGYGALYQMLAAVTALTRGVVDLDRALFSIKAISAATNEEMRTISATIKHVATTTKFDTTEIAAAAQTLSQAGVTPDEISESLSAVAHFAAGTETSIATAADTLSTMRNVFKEMDDLSISNQLTKVINISKLAGDDLKTILGISAATARQFNISSQQYLAAVGVLRNAGLKPSTVATGLRQGLLEILTPDAATLKALQTRYNQIGEAVNLEDISARFFSFTQTANPLVSVLRELKRIGLTGSGKKLLTRSFDVRAVNAIVNLANNVDQLENFEAQLTTGNSALDASATQMDSLAYSMDNLGATITVLAANITESGVRSLEDLVDAATEAAKAVNDLHTQSLAFGGGGLGDVAKLGIGSGALGYLATSALTRNLGYRAIGTAVGATVGTQQGIDLIKQPEKQDTLSTAGDAVLGATIGFAVLRQLAKIASAPLHGIQGFLRNRSDAREVAKLNALSKADRDAAALVQRRKEEALKSRGLLKKGFSSLGRAWPLLTGWVGAFAGLMFFAGDAILDFFNPSGVDKLKSELERAKSRAAGASRARVQATQARKEAEASLATFQFSDEGLGTTAIAGGEAQQRQELVQRIEQLAFLRGQTLEKVGGSLVNGPELAEVEKELKKLAADVEGAGGEVAKKSTAKIAKLIGVDLNNTVRDFNITISKWADREAAVISQLEGLHSSLSNEFKRLQDREAAGEITDVQKARLAAFRQVFDANQEFYEYLTTDGKSTTLSTLEIAQGMSSVTKLTAELGERISDLAGKREKEASNFETEITQTFNAAARTGSQEAVNAAIRRIGEKLKGIDGGLARYGDFIALMVGQYLETLEKFRVQSVEGARVQLASLQADLETADTKVTAARAIVNRAAPGDKDAALQILQEHVDTRDRLRRDIAAINSSQAAISPVETQASFDALNRQEQARRNAVENANKALLVEYQGILESLKSVSEGGEGTTIQANLDELVRASTSDIFNLVEAIKKAPKEDLYRFLESLTSAASSGRNRGQLSVDDELATLGGLLKRARANTTDLVKTFGSPPKIQTKYAIRDLPNVERGLQLDREIAKAKAGDLKGLVEGSGSGLIQQKLETDLIWVQQQIDAQAENIEELKSTRPNDAERPDPAFGKKFNQELVKAAELDAKRQALINKARKEQDAILLELKKREIRNTKASLESQKAANSFLITSAAAEGDLEKLRMLQEDRLDISQKLVDLETEKLKLTKTDAATLAATVAANQATMERAEARAAFDEFSAAISKRAEFLGGGYTTFTKAGDARLATGVEGPRTRAQEVGNLQQRLSEAQDLEAEAYFNRQTVDPSQQIQAQRLLEERIVAVATLSAELEILTTQSTLAWQSMEVLNTSTITARLESMGSNVKNLADNVHGSLTAAFDSVGDAIVRTILDGENFGQSMKRIFSSMFADIAAQYAKTLINTGMIKLFGSLGGATSGAAGGTNIFSSFINGITGFFGGLFSKGGANLQTRKFASGESSIIPGRRRYKDDLLMGLLGGKEPIAVTEGESILNRKATQVLGDTGITAANKGDYGPLIGAAMAASGRMRAASKGGGKASRAAPASAGGAASPTSVQYDGRVTVANFTDKQAFEDFLYSAAGQRTVVNVIGKNQRSVRQYF